MKRIKNNLWNKIEPIMLCIVKPGFESWAIGAELILDDSSEDLQQTHR